MGVVTYFQQLFLLTSHRYFEKLDEPLILFFPGGNQAIDARYSRTSSCSDADVPETSVIDMLKSNTKKPDANPVADSSLDTALGGRSSKKKGKKGRQIDPALLGFKVTSNRIMRSNVPMID